ncbi:MAG: hypothetical protein A3G81_25290 [Betaproteobacteria bacterium RIFCSPLOWO2_12_FULL_65_14]|nr:MAG: hypothetical protein A3G81_25290 [Betaproteobacteria bacterium RIFCSPLOWO2_12_FULL_65_14]
MKIACIVRCIGVAVFAAALQAGAQPPEGKGKPERAGPSPLIRFPVPQHSVGVVMRSSKSQGVSVVGDGRTEPLNAKAAKFAGVALSAAPSALPAVDTKPAVLECGTR